MGGSPAGVPTCDFVLMGESGFIGSKMLEAIKPDYNVVLVPGIRLHQRTELRAFIEAAATSSWCHLLLRDARDSQHRLVRHAPH